MAETRIGISGWLYPGWRKRFYPEGLTHARELAYVASKMNSAEINGSFYSLQRPSCYLAWRAATPDGFLFSVKGSRFITHMKKLSDPKIALANFFASGILALEEKLGPVLWQLPPNLGYDRARLEAFFDALPRTFEQAARLGRNHDHRLKERAHLSFDEDRRIRHALEVRHPTFMNEDFVALLRAHEVALCVADTAGKFPFFEDVTSDFVYVRLHGDTELYASGYSDEALDGWARKVIAWEHGREAAGSIRVSPKGPPRRPRDVFVYFDNDAKVHAPFDAIHLAEKVGVEWEPGEIELTSPRRRATAPASKSSRRSPTRSSTRARRLAAP